jgi:hypothetical protein
MTEMQFTPKYERVAPKYKIGDYVLFCGMFARITDISFGGELITYTYRPLYQKREYLAVVDRVDNLAIPVKPTRRQRVTDWVWRKFSR